MNKKKILKSAQAALGLFPKNVLPGTPFKSSMINWAVDLMF